MTIDEKREYLEEFCRSQKMCGECPITGNCTGVPFEKVAESDIEELMSSLEETTKESKQEQEANDLRINEEIIQSYCSKLNDIPCSYCPAIRVCGSKGETWHTNVPNLPTSAEKQRAVLDAFEAEFPPEYDEDLLQNGANIPELESVVRHARVCTELNELYKRKNADYGDSFHKSYEEWGLTMAAIRLGDKYNRFSSLVHKGGDSLVKDESIRDTLIDLANYAIMTVMELDAERNDKNGNEA